MSAENVSSGGTGSTFNGRSFPRITIERTSPPMGEEDREWFKVFIDRPIPAGVAVGRNDRPVPREHVAEIVQNLMENL